MATCCLIRLPVLFVFAAFASAAHAELPVERALSPQSPATSAVGLLNPLALVSEAIAALIGVEAQHVVLGSGERYATTLATRSAAIAATNELRVQFAASEEYENVSLLLAESQIRVRLAQDLQLRCEVSSQEELNTDPELKLDLRVQFKFK